MSVKWMGHSLIQRINSSLGEWGESLETELVLLRVYINVVFGGDRRGESGFSVLDLYYQPVALLLLDGYKFKPWPLKLLSLGRFFLLLSCSHFTVCHQILVEMVSDPSAV